MRKKISNFAIQIKRQNKNRMLSYYFLFIFRMEIYGVFCIELKLSLSNFYLSSVWRIPHLHYSMEIELRCLSFGFFVVFGGFFVFFDWKYDCIIGRTKLLRKLNVYCIKLSFKNRKIICMQSLSLKIPHYSVKWTVWTTSTV